MKVINFMLTGPNTKPIGGYKVIYEYANRLVADGHEVNVILPASLLWRERNIIYKIGTIIRYFYFLINKSKYLPYSWFELDERVKIYWTPTLEEKYIPNGDYVFATSCETAGYVSACSNKKGEKLYFIQSFEDWSLPRDRVIETWKMPIKKIVISNWLKEFGNELEEKTELLYNGLDFKKFNLSNSQRNNKQILMLYSSNSVKGADIGLKAIEQVKEKVKDVKIILFGVPKKPKSLPSYIEYYQNPSSEKLKELYNTSGIFLGSGRGEGWGLTIAEAMQCGCAVVCTDVNGYNEMAFNGKTALVSKNEDYESLSENIIKLIENDSLRIKISKEGNKFINRFTWEKSYKKLKEILELEK